MAACSGGCTWVAPKLCSSCLPYETPVVCFDCGYWFKIKIEDSDAFVVIDTDGIGESFEEPEAVECPHCSETGVSYPELLDVDDEKLLDTLTRDMLEDLALKLNTRREIHADGKETSPNSFAKIIYSIVEGEEE